MLSTVAPMFLKRLFVATVAMVLLPACQQPPQQKTSTAQQNQAAIATIEAVEGATETGEERPGETPDLDQVTKEIEND